METSERIQQYFKEFKVAFEPYFNRYLEEKLGEFTEIDTMGQLLTEKMIDFSVGGGKRIRAVLVALGYQAGGGEKSEDIFSAAVAIELLHNFLLIHDDIIDLSDIRRARPTMHKMFEAWSGQVFENSAQSQHFCHSMAILVGDLSCVMATEALTLANLPAERIVQAFQKMYKIGRDTVIGQGLDVVLPLEQEVSEESVMQIYLLKTAKYTIEGPLHVGLILAGADQNLLEKISRYAIPVGIAFQIQDDILGVFGTEEELGKSVTSDIKEGKQTLLTVAAYRLGTAIQRERLKFLLGNPQVSPADIEEVREIMRLSSALDYARSRAKSLVEDGKVELKKLPIGADTKQVLEELADYIVERTF
ncbi:MAG: polyprenyl synthetase family protein [Patescibacteria group bacterium]